MKDFALSHVKEKRFRVFSFQTYNSLQHVYSGFPKASYVDLHLIVKTIYILVSSRAFAFFFWSSVIIFVFFLLI